jgi:large subunit ribosomal protein L29
VARPSEIRELTDDEIETRLTETKEELFNLRFQNATGQLDNYRRLGQLRREVAQLNTIIRERQLAR